MINNLETESSEEIPVQTRNGKRAQSSSRELAGNSRLFYYSRCADGGWREAFAVNCYISGGSGEDEDIYGVYRLDSAFGLESDPGSLVSYRQLSQKDYWITDPEDEDFGAIYTAGEEGPGTKEAVRLGEMKAFSNYGMILKPETEGDAYPALVVNCQQASTEDDTFSGIQLSQSHVRMLIQSIDQDTRIMIAGEVEDLEECDPAGRGPGQRLNRIFIKWY